jgi:hypothetical protein
MIEQPEMTNQQLFSNIREARERSARGLASEDPDQNALGHAYGRLADAYEAFAGRQLGQARPGAPTLAEFQQARVAFAKNYLAQEALKGGEHFDPAVYGRAAQGNPDLLSGGGKIVGDAYNTLPAAGGDTGAKAIGALGGTVVGAALEHVLGPGAGIPAGVGSAVTGAYVAPAVNNAIRRFFTRGNPEAAAGAATNPRLSYQFASPLDSQNALFGGRPTPPAELTPPPGVVGVHPVQGSLGDLLQGPPAAPQMDLTPPPGRAVEPMQRSLGDLAQGLGTGPANTAARLKQTAEARPEGPGGPVPRPMPEPLAGHQPPEGRLPKRLGDFARELAKRLGDEF